MSGHRERLAVTCTIPPQLRERLGSEHELVDVDETTDRSAFRIAVTTSMDGFSANLMDSFPNLGMIACNGVGLDKIDLAAAEQRGISVRNTPGVLTEDVADAAIGMMFAVVRRIAEADRFVRAGRWEHGKMALSRRVQGCEVGIVGMGRIGRAIGLRCNGLGLDVNYNSPSPKGDLPFAYEAEIIELARKVDILILACPGGAANRHLVNAEVLAALGPAGYLVNVARGEVVDQQALIAALTDGGIAGAALDVFEEEPLKDNCLINLDNVVLQPHYAALTEQTRAAIAEMLAEAVAEFLGKT